MKAGKIIGGVALGLIAIIAVVVYFILSNLDQIIKTVIEDVGSKVTKTSVTLDSAHLDLKTGKGQLRGLTIANPPGYASDYAFRLDNIVVGIDASSLGGPVIVITEVTVDGAKLIAEQKGAKTNLSELLANVDSSAKQPQEQPAPEASEEDGGVHLMLESFAFINSSATVITELKGESSLQLPDLHQQNIGDKTTGLTPQQLATAMLRNVIRQVEKAVTKYLGQLAREAAEEKLKEKLGDEGSAVVDGLKSLFSKD